MADGNIFMSYNRVSGLHFSLRAVDFVLVQQSKGKKINVNKMKVVVPQREDR